MKSKIFAWCAALCVLPLLLCMGIGAIAHAGGDAVTIAPKAVMDTIKVSASTHSVAVNQTQVNPQAYNIGGYNYFKLRDIAYLLQNTSSQFDVEWKQTSKTIDVVSGESYTIVGGEMATDTASNLKVLESTARVTVDGKSVSVGGYNINNNNYYKIADLAKAIGFAVSFDEETRTVQIEAEKLTDDPEDASNVTDETQQEEEEVIPPRTSHLDGVLTIMVDAGHGGSDKGASNATYDLDEKHINLYVAEYLKEMLEASGVKVIMVRETLEEGSSLYERGALMEEYKDSLDLFFSIHHNAATTQARGAQVLAQVADKEGGPTKTLAEELAVEYAKVGLTLRDTWFREGDNGDYYYTNRAAAALQIPAVISEYCFIDNDEDVLFVNSEEGWQREAQAQYNAIMRYYETAEY